MSGTALANADPSFDQLLRNMAATSGMPVTRLPAVGEVVAGKYRIEERLGGGGMGAVFSAKHLVSEKLVAVKWMLRPASDEHARRRFVREARAAARIEHPNVVDVYDAGQQGELGLYIVMQLLRGETLSARIKRGPLAVDEAVQLLLPAMLGVSAVHRAGIIHRDLKPDNIFLCEARHGGAEIAKVLDFGISAMAACDPNDPTLTRDGAVLGTPAYMSPEQLRSSRSVDVRADVYSFGVILYEALTGALPFSADSYNGLILEIVNGVPKRPREMRPELPAELEQIVLRAMAKRCEERYGSIEALIDALVPFQAREPSARAGARLGRRLSRPRTWLSGLALSCAVALAFGLLGRTETARKQRSAAAEVSTAPVPPPPPAAPRPPERPLPTPTAATSTAPLAPSPPPKPETAPAARAKKRRGPEASPGMERTQQDKAAKAPHHKARSGTISADEL